MQAKLSHKKQLKLISKNLITALSILTPLSSLASITNPPGVDFFPDPSKFGLPSDSKVVIFSESYSKDDWSNDYNNPPKNPHPNNYPDEINSFEYKKIGEAPDPLASSGNESGPKMLPLYETRTLSIRSENGPDGPNISPSTPFPGGTNVNIPSPEIDLINSSNTSITTKDGFLFIPSSTVLNSSYTVITEESISGSPSYGSSPSYLSANSQNTTWTKRALVGQGLDYQTKIDVNGISFMGKNYISREGLNAQDLKITHVKAGEISPESTDAVNGRQLWELEQKIKGPSLKPIYEVGAMSAALAALHPLPFNKKNPFSIMAAYGNYKSENAFAIGMSYYAKKNLRFNSAVSLVNRHNSMFNIGLAYQFGNSQNNRDFILTNEIQHREGEIAHLKTKLDQYESELERYHQKDREFDERLKNLQNQIDLLKKSLNK